MGKTSGLKINDINDGDTKILFKKSNATNFSRSRTMSGASQLYSRSGIMQIKKNSGTNHHRYYTDRGKIKRDFSVETDICILRRYYRKKKNSLLGETSGKSRYSTLVDTECETIEEYPDTSGCGDNDNDTEKSNPPLDIASLMIDNLKDLLNQWIQKHLIQNKDTKQKIDTVLDSLIRKLETRNNLASSSGSTYILHKQAGKQEVKNKKIATASLTCQCCKHKARYVNIGSSAAVSSVSQKRSFGVAEPFNYKDIRIISTLSIPRSFHRRGLEEKKEQNSWYRMKKIKHKNLVLSIDRSNNKFMNSSSFDLVAISTKSLTKKSTNNETISKKKKRHIVFFPKPFYKSATETSSATNDGSLQIKNAHVDKDRLDAMPSLLESLYANDPIMPDKNVHFARDTQNNNYTMTEDNSISEVTINNAKVATEITNDIYAKQAKEKYLLEENKIKSFGAMDSTNRRIEYTNTKKTCLELPKTKSNCKKPTNRGKINKLRQRSTFQTIHNKHFTFLYKKAQSQTSPEREFLKHCQNIMQFFDEYKNNNIKLDVQINVYPTGQSNKKDVYTDVSYQTLGVYDIKFNPTLLNNKAPTKTDAKVHTDEEPVKYKIENENYSKEHHHLPDRTEERTPKIIPLLDSSVCQTKFIFDVNSTEKVEAMTKPNIDENIHIEQSTITTELEIAQEISELRAVIKDLAAAAERFVNEQLRRESNKSNAETIISRNPSNYTSSSKVEAVINLRNPSKAIQYSKETIDKQKLLSGLKITKEPKKKETFDFYNKLVKKSTSYRIIDSESILRVTDMTSGANEMNEPTDTPETRETTVTKEALRRSTQKSKSLFELTSEQSKKRKLVSLFCEGYRKNLQCRVCSVHRIPSPASFSDKSINQFKKLFGWTSKKGGTTCQRSITRSELPPCICRSDTNCTDSMPMFHPEPLRDPVQNSFSSIEVLCPCDPDKKTVKNCFIEDEQVQDQIRRKERRGMGFGEGCVYCVLLWIPVFLLICFFYAYVLRDRIKYMTLNETHKPHYGRHEYQTPITVRLSDLGF